MKVSVVRHAHAGRKSEWAGPDEARPLSELGEAQARALGLSLPSVELLVVSPTVRCHQTLEPLAERLGLEIESDGALAKSSPLSDTMALLDRLVADGRSAAICSHVEVLGPMMRELESDGVRLLGGKGTRKASVWTIKTNKGQMVKATYQKPPDVKIRS